MGDHDTPAESGRSLPEDIASGAGLPRSGHVEHSLHTGGGRASGEAEETLRAATAASLGRLNRGGDSHRDNAGAHEAPLTAAELHDRAGEAAGSVRDRAAGALNEARERATDAYDDVRGWAADRYDEHSGRASDLADRGYRKLREGRTATEQFVSENPLLVGVVGLAAGLLLGALLPRTRQEDRALGPYADEVRDQGLRYARDFTDRGRAFVESALDPENLDAAVKRATAPGDAPQGGGTQADEGPGYEGPDRKAHTL